jgi:AraC-like DNA-binding protein
MATPLRDAVADRAGSKRLSSYCEFAPSDATQLVLCTWAGQSGWPHNLRLFPDGCSDIVWDGRDLRIVGPSITATIGQLHAGATNVGVRLRPGTTKAVVGVPAWKLYAQSFRIRDLRPSEAAEKWLTHARTISDKRLILEQMIAEWTVPDAQSDLLRKVIPMLSREHTEIRTLATHLSVPARDLRRLFAEHVGLSAKSLQRIARFRALLDRLPDLAARRVGAAGLAADLGYADQSDMTRDCRRIAGEPPLALARKLAA